MKYLLISLIVLASASPELMKKLGLGKTCDDHKSWVTTDFTVTPYPPVAGKVFQVTMTGTFRNARYVSDIDAKVNFNGGKYTDHYFDISQNCVVGQVYVFNYTLTAGTTQGVYGIQTHLDNSKDNSISCWEFTYHI